MALLEKQLNMNECFDVVVIGGGIAGVASALSAARENKKVVLIEKQCILGGLATSGLIAIYLPICDGLGHQISFGISEELLKLSIQMGCQRKYPKAWLEDGSLEEKTKQRFEAQYNPNYFALLLEKLLLENNVIIYYDALLTRATVNDGLISSIDIETLEGEKTIFGDSFIDCSGDARLAYLANEKTRVYQKGNIVAGWYYYMEDGKLLLNKLGIVEKTNSIDSDRKSEEPLTNSRFFGGSYNDQTSFILESHQQTLLDISNRKKRNDNFEVTTLSMMPEMRMTRCVDCCDVLLDDIHNKHIDSIGLIADWRRRGYVYELPYRTIKTNINNLFVAGRCINVNDDMWDITRAIPCCAVSGEAAGLAASMFASSKNVNVEVLQNKLKENGQKLFIEEIE